MSKFKPGDKVVCIDDSFPDKMTKEMFDEIYKNWIKKDNFYIIRSTRNSLNGWFGVLLEEIRNPSVFMDALGGKAEPGFAEWRFRKVEEKKLEETVEQEQEEEIYALV